MGNYADPQGISACLIKLTMFQETEAAFPYCKWSIKISRIIWFGSTSVDIGPAYLNNWKRLGHISF